MLTQSQLKEMFHYQPESGDLVWLVNKARRIKIGDQAGSMNGDGYLKIGIDGKIYQAHRLAWLYEHGFLPPDQIDHINGTPSDNRLENLRPATPSENMRNRGFQANNKSGHKGVHWHRGKGKWCAEIRVHGVKKHLGYFDVIEDAALAYISAAKVLHGEFMPTGSACQGG